MRLTVGPLPAAVYWRRRAVVFVGIAMVVLVVTYSCGGPDQQVDAHGARASSTSPTPQPGPATTVLRPTVPNEPAKVTPTPTAFVLPATGQTGPCTDAELRITVRASTTSAAPGGSVPVTIEIKNVSTRECGRDIGADVQELRLVDAAKTLMWSSDDCSPNKGHNVRRFAAGQKATFTLTWPGRRSRTGTGSVTCSGGAPAPAAGADYQLIARLDQLVSDPFGLRITG